jgi:hypothetical protein
LRKIPRTKEPPVIFGCFWGNFPEPRNLRLYSVVSGKSRIRETPVIFGSLKRIQNQRTSGYTRLYLKKNPELKNLSGHTRFFEEKNPESQNLLRL